MQKPDFLKGRKGITFVDLFAGAGGFSEGFMQAYTDKNYYDFILASDINENCELTHRVRYNKMLGLDTEFICQDIMEESFLPNLLKKLKNKTIDVVTGGPSCQSFSLAGRRKKLDKRDDLFEHYLKVIKALRPKYFVMENVKGILTKDGGKIKERIIHEIRSIVEESKMPLVYDFLDKNLKKELSSELYTILVQQLHFLSEEDNTRYETTIYDTLEQQFQVITRNIPYEISKSNVDVNTVRHGLIILKKSKERAAIRKSIIQLKTVAHIDNDRFVNSYNDIIESISSDSILESIFTSLEEVKKLGSDHSTVESFKANLELLTMTFDEIIDFISSKFSNKKEVENWHTERALRPEASQGPDEVDGNPVHLLRHPHSKRGAAGRQDRAESTAGGCLKRKYAHREVLSRGNCASVIENGQKIRTKRPD